MKHVHIGGFTGCEGNILRDAVRVSRTKTPAYKIVRAASNLSFSDWLATRKPGDLIVCGFDAPSVVVANALARRERYEDTLRIWLDEASQALALTEAEPGMMILVNICAVQADPEGLARLLAARTGMQMMPSKRAQPLRGGLIYRPLAERLVADRADVEEMAEELSATALIDGGTEPTREQLHAALEADRLDAEARDQVAREHAALVRALANAHPEPDAVIHSLSKMGEPDDPDAAKARERLEGLIAVLQGKGDGGRERRTAAAGPFAAAPTGADATGIDAATVAGRRLVERPDYDSCAAIIEILALAAEDVQRAEAEAQMLQDALELCSEEAQSRTLEPPPGGSYPATGNGSRPHPGPSPEIVGAVPEAYSSVPAAGAEATRSAAPTVAGLAGPPTHSERTRAPNAVMLMRDYLVVRWSRLFDADWYRSWYADLRSVRDPALHFVLHGAREGRAASAYFSAYQYRAEYADVARSGVNPLVHYELIGRKERRRVFPVVEAFQSLEKN